MTPSAPTTRIAAAKGNGRLEPLAVDAEEVGRLLGVSGRTVKRMGADGRLPAPFKLGSKSVWLIDGLKEHLSRLHRESQGLGVEPAVSGPTPPASRAETRPSPRPSLRSRECCL